MLQFPPIPDCKKYTEGSDLTLEALTMQKAFTKQKLSSDDDRILAECAEFYEHAFTYLKEVNLSTISENDNQLIKEYLQEVLRFQLIFQTGINFHRVYRVSIVRDSFLVDGRVKDINFLKNPPLDLIQRLGVYGRCNSDSSTRFYSSFDAYTAILETKPRIGDKIILTEWRNVSN